IDEVVGSVTLIGSVAFSYTVNVKLYLAFSYQYASVKADIKLDGEVSLSGKLTLVEIPLGEINIPIMTEVYASFKPSLQAEVSGSISFDFAVKTTLGAYYDSDQSGIHSLCSSPGAEYKTKFEGTLYIGLKLKGSIIVVDERISDLSLEGTAGAEITMKEDIQTLSSASSSKSHTCELCFAGTATAKVTASAKFKLLNGKVDLKATLLSCTNKLFDFYYSGDHDEWGFYATCPYISYLCTVTVTDTSGNPVIGAVITCDALEEPVAANENGVATFYLPNGTYSLEVSGSDDSGNELTGTKTLTVADNKKVPAVTLSEEGGGGSSAGGSTDEEDTSESEAEAETVASGTCGDDLTWVLDSNGVLTISGTGAMTDFSAPNQVPWHNSYASSIAEIVMEEGVTSIGSYAFSYCTNLLSVTIPDSVTSIGNQSFFLCESLTSITIPKSVYYIDSRAFQSCYSLTSIAVDSENTCYSSSDGILFNNDFTAFLIYPVGKTDTTYAIPDTVTYVGDYAFYNCLNLVSVTIPDSVTAISSYMFQACYYLTYVAIPDSVTSIGSGAFYGCSRLASVTIPDSVTAIGNGAFSYSGLTSVTLPDGVTSIDAFGNCTSLTSVTIPGSVTSIGSYAFYNCTSLTSVTILDGVTTIYANAFLQCTALTSVTIPTSVTYIGKYAFSDCWNISDVYYTGSESEWAAISIYSYNTNLTSASIHYNYDADAGETSADESSESVTDSEAETETETETEAQPEDESDTSSDSVQEAATASGRSLSLNSSLSGRGAVVSLMAYTGFTTSTDSTQTTTFTGLVSGEAYVLLVMRDAEAEDLLAADNLLYIAQANADESGSITFSYIPRETVDGAVSYAYGTSSQNLTDAEITLEADSFAYTGGAIKPLATVIYNGVTLEADVDYTMSYSDNTEVGTATATIKGRGDYAGTVTQEFTIIKAEQTLTASIDTSELLVGDTAQITAAAQGTLSYESSDTSVATVDETGLVTGLSAGTAAITVTAAATDSYNAATATLTITVTKITNLSDCTVTVASVTYTGSALTPVVTVADEDGNTLTKGTDYTVTCEDNMVNASSYAVTVTGLGDYTGNATATFTIAKANLSNCTVTAANATYTGKALTPAVTVKNGSATLASSNYTVSYSNNTNAGTGTVTVTGKGNYTGTVTATFTIAKANLANYTVTAANATYTGKALTPAVTVKNGSATLASSNYTVSYSNNTNAGTGTVKVTGKGNYTGTATATFTIAKASQTVTASAGASTIYAGKTTTVTGTGTGSITYSSSDTSIATVSSSGKVTGKKPGTVKITVKAAGNSNYNAASATITIKVKLNKATISSLTNTSKGITVKWKKVTGASGYYIYRKTSGGKYKKIATVTGGSTVKYTDTAVKSKNGTTYIYAVRAYSGSSQGSYTGKTVVRLTGVSISNLKNVKTKKITVKWSKNSKATGYQIQYSTSSSFSSKKTVKVKGYKNVSKTISSLTKGKKYYVRVRAYKTVSGTTYYSAWSSKKSVKISK
ncbi:MAG: leucine-rich repeat protein, partial [Lachnospiraceae bacterium]|nr:leucine-rich repeat protein [Lachnospiraceae bacterium]